VSKDKELHNSSGNRTNTQKKLPEKKDKMRGSAKTNKNEKRSGIK